ncbi:MAG: HD domain-containing protein [Planctomycetales bacterium]|nr:HD domain-containing protein [Planctomycetales bacterium]
MHPVLQQILNAFEHQGAAQYGQEAVTQLQHALQCAQLAKDSGASNQLIVAALLHDIGHILETSPIPTSCEQNLDDKHEAIGYHFLLQHFGAAVADPVRLHVLAKRYLCTKNSAYEAKLSPTSRKSYYDQGGQMSVTEVTEFEREPYCQAALQLRIWDDTAKDPDAMTQSIVDFLPYLESAVERVGGED